MISESNSQHWCVARAKLTAAIFAAAIAARRLGVTNASSEVEAPLPVVTIVIPCWNAEQWVGRAIRSGLDQRGVEPRVVVVDDGSTDGSLNVIRSFGESILWKTGENLGANVARNWGLYHSDAEWIMFLDADDYIAPGSLAAWTAAGDGRDVVFGPFAYERTGRLGPSDCVSAQDGYGALRRWISGRFTPSCSVLWKRNFLLSIGGWKEPSPVRNQDGELAMRALLMGAVASVSASGLGVYVQHNSPGRVSRRGGEAAVRSDLALFEDLWALAQRQDHSDLRREFAHAFYQIARKAHALGVHDVGSRALDLSRQLGFRGHHGTLAHRTVATVFGLRWKSKAASTMQAVQQRFSTGR